MRWQDSHLSPACNFSTNLVACNNEQVGVIHTIFVHLSVAAPCLSCFGHSPDIYTLICNCRSSIVAQSTSSSQLSVSTLSYVQPPTLHHGMVLMQLGRLIFNHCQNANVRTLLEQGSLQFPMELMFSAVTEGVGTYEIRPYKMK